ncbi:hypothetical protein DV713_00035 [Parageobacillus thermoglucosidasius]|uniref:hypothetical protein n=1 Tax=Parageobacillus thermoglucosidasius TaxID=1426 RepID=UPI000E152F77|nr:hypothetical protein [Parageobacillus thermoglucosidasius]RDE36619.1 hypothetical protein DV713_00035 [Parageobacillus thermoglucosidasius]
MPKRIGKRDSRLWNKGDVSKIVPYTSRSLRLAEQIMKTLGVKESIIDAFKNGEILVTNSLRPTMIVQEGVTDRDKEIIDELDQNGLMVYHVLFSCIMLGKKPDIQSEFEVNTFEQVVPIKSYLYVPKDIFEEAIYIDPDLMDKPREVVIKEYVEHTIFKAKQGYLSAYTLNEETNVAMFDEISVSRVQGDLIRVE